MEREGFSYDGKANLRFLENKRGRIYRVAKALAAADINIRALSIADTSAFGILRLIVDAPEKALATLQEANITAKISQVIAVEVADTPAAWNGFSASSKPPTSIWNISMPSSAEKVRDAILIFQVENPQKAIETLEAAGVRLVQGQELYEL